MGQVAVAPNTRIRTRLAILSDVVATPASPVASGGTVTIAGGYVYHTFTTSGTLLVYSAGTIDYLVVAGGGGGGRGGGGAGGMLTATAYSIAVGSQSITVGGGGIGGVRSGGDHAQGGDGTNSILGSIATATGGGGGGGGNAAETAQTGRNGGSGGGAGASGTTNHSGGTGVGGQGFAGGATSSTASPYSSAGGGGASTVGQNTPSNGQGGNGGTGTAWLNGTAYAGGGGGAVYASATTQGTGGTGGGGNASRTAPTAGTANTGGGGGGAGDAADGAAGGSGIVIVRYPLVTTNYATGGTVTSDSTQIIHTFTAGGTFALAQAGLLDVSYAVVGAGGGGSGGTNGVNVGSGGAGGTIRSGTSNIVASQSVTIGTGGAGVAGTGNTGGNGASSVFGTVATATGGNGAPPSTTGGANADFAGGTNSGGSQDSGGGAGAGATGGTVGVGGIGVEWPAASGTYYGGGGGGSEGGAGAAGGAGGGGAGRHFNQGGNGTSGTANTGGGGGGSYNGAASSGSGGSGVVIVRYSPGAFQPGHPLGLGSDLWAWYDPTQGVTGGATVTQWDDQSGNARHATPGAAASPSSGTRTVNSINVIDFDGTNDGLGVTSGASLGMTNFTVIFLGQQDVTVASAGFLTAYLNSAGHDYDNTSSMAFAGGNSGLSRVAQYDQNSNSAIYSGSPPTPLGVWSIRKTGTAVVMQKNGAQVATATITATGTADRLSMGWRAKEGLNYLDGCLGDVIICSAALSDANWASTTLWTRLRWGQP